jgi:hypothetical protein
MSGVKIVMKHLDVEEVDNHITGSSTTQHH